MSRVHTTVLVLIAGLLGASPACSQGSFEQQRAAMVEAIEQDVGATRSYTGRERLADAVMEAMARVPRHEFVPDAVLPYAYENRPLPIGEGQTISQPYIVALMTDLAEVGPESAVLEIGTGSGYQAAVLAEVAGSVHTIEIVEPLGRSAAATLERLGYDNVTVRVGDGYAGWPEFAPFDAILVTAAPERIPQPLIDQLAVGGRLVAPVGAQNRAQSLQVLEKTNDGSVRVTDVLPVVFVPFTRAN